MGGGPFCLVNYQVMREDMDVVSVHFRPMDRVSVPVHSVMPSVMRLYLNTGMDSGGSLTISLWANKSMISNNTLVMVCVNAASPFLHFNTSLSCTTGMGRQLLTKQPWPAPLATSDLPDYHAFLLPYSLLPGLLPVSEHLISQGQTHHPLPRDRQLVPLPAACVPSES